MGLLRFLALAALVYLLFRIIARFLLPWLTKKVVKKATERMEEQVKQRQQGQKIYQDEKVTIRKTQDSSKKGKNNTDDDEYVDFEEV
jgi:lipopolysaccharide export LptBFGC system permease protein LptF